MTSLSLQDQVTSLDLLCQQDLSSFREQLMRQKRTAEEMEGLVPQARVLFLRKILSRMLALCCDEETASTSQELKVLHSVIGTFLSEAVREEPPLTDLERQKRDFDKQTAEFSKIIAKKEKIIADQIKKSQKYIAGLHKKMAS